ncbi:DUF2288 domain-containing protein [Coleofasciculus sp. FACHB-64]|jgi:hypothetical protein|uniref:DUF2288 domain-containing protein n=1 Tax=Cyanophyceae TaxID=3028117 RepID=UPI00168236CA|nr:MULTISPECIES: DUF2288 domain-containing protein [unclassified Coleofasciculus]MBD1841494.1 DUF2288 domain-containing protein [Coleofasciculus sp. FACHB-501]MBD1877770.1 DUF2288 domain-containing protein [Coleofasciculus sp. FACHB-T130]MBD1889545.1 DUF2288 domain-containing protein [Coleofasciculus sp. FACHB-SPT9]MBD1894617.1 DUF2288 domain-containing protein [Coleofasciculus sp. FACHB-129]MBD1903247.1 DUF2288 domain-containing protein [Coleofasciculus sp. FACHB-125]
MQGLREELAELLDEAEWNWLMPHAEREAVVIVAQELDLLDVGVAIANDDVSSVQHWISEQLIYKPSEAQKQDWNDNKNKRFSALIVSPYVLVKETATIPA